LKRAASYNTKAVRERQPESLSEIFQQRINHFSLAYANPQLGISHPRPPNAISTRTNSTFLHTSADSRAHYAVPRMTESRIKFLSRQASEKAEAAKLGATFDLCGRRAADRLLRRPGIRLFISFIVVCAIRERRRRKKFAARPRELFFWVRVMHVLAAGRPTDRPTDARHRR
jgi:hypothetical protein